MKNKKLPNKSKTIKNVEDSVWWTFRAYAFKQQKSLADALKELLKGK